MKGVSAGYEVVSRSYFLAHQDPIRHADEILGIRIIRDPDTGPAEPLRVAIDQSVVDHMGWRAGDALTLVPHPGGAEKSQGQSRRPEGKPRRYRAAPSGTVQPEGVGR